MNCMQQPKPSAITEMDPPGHVLDALMRSLRVSNVDLADFVGISRQAVDKRRKCQTSMSAADIANFATVIGVERELFFGTAIEALQWVIANQPERLAYHGGEDGGEAVKLRPLADVVQWNYTRFHTIAA